MGLHCQLCSTIDGTNLQVNHACLTYTMCTAASYACTAETVALFNNQRLEVEQYNEYLKGYMKAAINTERLAAILNTGQSVILAIGLTTIMITAISTTK